MTSKSIPFLFQNGVSSSRKSWWDRKNQTPFSKMMNIWSYIIVALCMTVTSSRVMDSLGNRNDFHDNPNFGVKEEKVLTPPSNNGLNIDSNGFPGNSNGQKDKQESEGVLDWKKLCLENDGDSYLCDQPSFLSDLFAALQNQNDKSKEFDIIPFSKEDITNLEGSELCKIMCDSGVTRPPCICK